MIYRSETVEGLHKVLGTLLFFALLVACGGFLVLHLGFKLLHGMLHPPATVVVLGMACMVKRTSPA
jgi:hypothetical protein